jgi:hypothetical protein
MGQIRSRSCWQYVGINQTVIGVEEEAKAYQPIEPGNSTSCICSETHTHLPHSYMRLIIAATV